MKSAVPHIAFALALGAASGVSAQTLNTGDFPRTVVHYSDLDLASPSGVRALQRRVDSAVRSVCRPTPDARQLWARKGHRDCISTAKASVSVAQAEAIQRAQSGIRDTTLAKVGLKIGN
jgi:UrcA family protein